MVETPVDRRSLLRMTGIVTVGSLAGCLSEDDDDDEEGADADATVTVGPDNNTRFEPEELEIEPGDQVAFIWDSGGHSIDVQDQPEESDWEGVSSLSDEETVHEHTFEVEGRYEYQCSAHYVTDMNGTILVGDTE